MIRNEPRPWTPLVLVIAALSAAHPTANASAAAPPAAFVCVAAGKTPGTARPALVSGVEVADQFSTATATVASVDRLCAPVGLDGAPPSDGTTQLLRHGSRPSGHHGKIANVSIDNALGAHAFDLGRPTALLAPSAVDANATPPVPDFSSHDLDRYQCYSARGAGAPSVFTQAGTIVQVTDSSGTTRALEVLRPRRLCARADVAGVAKKHTAGYLACYTVRPVAGARVRGLHVDAGFGAATIDTRAPREVCLPSHAVHSCNGTPELCDRPFDRIAYATTHNAMSNAEDGFGGPNQQYAVTRQLADGVRGFMLDTYYSGPNVALCHAFCVLGERPLLDTLVDIREFFERNPYEVASIIFESYVSAADTEAVFAAAGLLPYVHAQAVGDPWPTLREMITANHRLVVFTDSGGGSYPWYHDVWDYAFETNYSFATPADLSCTPNRGNPSNSLFILNHFLTNVFGSPALAEQINHNPLFIDRAKACALATAALPNFVTVDYYNIGDVLAVVDELNGF